MKNLKKVLIAIVTVVVVFSCSEDDKEILIDKNSEVINYMNSPNTENELLSKVYLKDGKTTTYIYGNTDNNGVQISIQSIAHKVDNSDKTDFILLDELQRVTYIYSEVDGIKQNEIHSFSYPEEGLVNYMIIDRDWATLNDEILSFKTIEIDEKEFISNNILGKASSSKGPEWDAFKANLGVVVGIAGAAILLVTAETVLLGVFAAVVFASAASASETPADIANSDAPSPPEIELVDNQCANSSLEVIIGVDPGNVLVAIVNGNSLEYKFHWSTGETATAPISHVITAPDDGPHYVIAVDHKGCMAFASTNSSIDSIPIYEAAVLGEWSVKSLGNNPNDVRYELQLDEGGTGAYLGDGTTIYPTPYGMSWYIYRGSDGRYYFHDSGFWHGAFNSLERDPLSYPLKVWYKHSSAAGNGLEPVVRYEKL